MAENQPPPHLTTGGKALWRAVVDDYDVLDWQLSLLEAACDALDRMVEARRVVAEDGIIVRDRYDKPKAHPAVAIERDSRLALARLLRELALEVVGPPVGARPPRIRSVG